MKYYMIRIAADIAAVFAYHRIYGYKLYFLLYNTIYCDIINR